MGAVIGLAGMTTCIVDAVTDFRLVDVKSAQCGSPARQRQFQFADDCA